MDDVLVALSFSRKKSLFEKVSVFLKIKFFIYFGCADLKNNF
jgi:hypothetical protein